MAKRIGLLDDLDAMRKIDRSGMLKACENFPDFCREAITLTKDVTVKRRKIEGVIVAGMGGSAIGGSFLKQLFIDNPKVKVPIEVCREYFLPAYVDERRLVFIVSYSGETEETLNVFVDALKRNCMVICISSGGAITHYARKLDLPHVTVPSGLAPRAAFPFLFLPMLIILQKLGVTSTVESEIGETIETLEVVKDGISPETPFEDNQAKKIALEILGTVPIVYGFRYYGAVAQRIKAQLNENSKVPCKCEVFPELNHNEIVGWEAPRKLTEVFSVIFLRDEAEPKEVKWRIETTKELIAPKVGKTLEIWGLGRTRLAKMFSATYIGDFMSVYLALLQRVDPTPVKTITLLKEKMKKAGLKEKAINELRKICGET